MIVFCIEPVGTFTACTMKVMPNNAMTTVTTADSKYSRQTDFGGPFGLVSGTGCFSWPFRLKKRAKEKARGWGAVSLSISVVLVLGRLLLILNHPRYVKG